MKTRTALVLAGVLLAGLPLQASPPDGILLLVAKDATPGSVRLDWTGGQPGFSVYRSTSPGGLVSPGNLLGQTPVRTWSDTPPPGTIFFYEITSPCVYAPPEVCDGLDNDCNGTIDGPGSEASCSLPNATASCSGGACAVASCNTGYGDCDLLPTNGCETDTHVAQSTSPASYGGPGNPDLAPGYVRVTAITNCGACGVSCNDNNGCTTDLCVPVGQVGVCRSYDRAQCSEARCAGPLPQGTPPPLEPSCTGADADGDGLSVEWETVRTDPYTGTTNPAAGIDLNCDGILSGDDDLLWHEPPAGDGTRDVYLEYDYMTAAGAEPSHDPPEDAVARVVSAFAGQGTVVHIDPSHQPLPHAALVYLPVTGPDPCAAAGAVSLYDPAYKGNPANFDPKRRIGYHYFLFGHSSCSASSSGAPAPDGSGVAEIGGQDGIVSLGHFPYTGTSVEIATKKDMEVAGTFMHELGHNLGLCHGGPADLASAAPCDSGPSTTLNKQPNHISVMNYNYQLPVIHRAQDPGTVWPPDPTVPWRPDYSHGVEIPVLVEAGGLDEPLGVGIGTPPYDRDIARYFCGGAAGLHVGPGSGPIDWNCDHQFLNGVTADINDQNGATEVLTAQNDWANLFFRFQCQPSYADGASPPGRRSGDELTLAIAQASNLRAGALVCDAAHADCNGNPADGCETAIDSDPEHCGTCNVSCTAQYCTLGSTCTSGVCTGGTPRDCSDQSTCTIDGCNEANDVCTHVNAPSGTACDDGLYCTVGETCNATGSCAGGQPRSCNDGVLCTVDTCSETQDTCLSTCSTNTACWSVPLGTGTTSTPVNDTALHPGGGSRTYVAQGGILRAVDSATGAPVWTQSFPGTTLNNFPAPVPCGPSAQEVIFMTAGNGLLYKVDASTGAVLDSKDTKRAGHPGDSILATPAIQLYASSDATFKNAMDAAGHPGDDLVFVITRYEDSGEFTRNKVYAYYSDDLATKWIFNDDGSHVMDYGSDGCTIDYATNTLFCGTVLRQGRTGNSLWSLDSVSGGVKWSTNAGSILNRPTLNYSNSAGSRLYVATAAGSLHAYNPAGNGAGGALRLWSAPVALAAPPARAPAVELRSGTFQNKLLILDSAGALHAVADHGSSGALAWSSVTPGLTWTSLPVVLPSLTKVYVGRSDGTLQQLDTSTGAQDAVFVAGGGAVLDGALDIENATDVNRLSVVALDAAGQRSLKRYCIPATTAPRCASDGDCTSKNGPCTQGRCDLTSGVCWAEPMLEGASCSGGPACASNNVCRGGTCVAQVFTSCPCMNVGDPACAPGQTCCGAATGCVDPNTNPQNCGACGVVCSPEQICSQGVCVSSPNLCVYATSTTLNSVATSILGADALAYDRPLGGVCNAYTSSYRTTVNSTVSKIGASGSVVNFVKTGDSTPLHGVVVPRQGDQIFAAFVNNGPLLTAGLGFVRPPTLGNPLVRPITSANTTGTGPFSAPQFNAGPVGPAFDYVSYTGADSSRHVYFGNWSSNGDVAHLTSPGGSWIANLEPLYPATPERVTAIALERRWNRQGPVAVYHRYLIVAHGTTLSFIDLDNGSRKDLDLANPTVYGGVTGILSIAVHPIYGDAYVEVKNAASQTLVVDVQDDYSVRHVRDVQIDQHVSPLIPSVFSNQGRLTVSPAFSLIRLVPLAEGVPVFTSYEIPR